MRTGLVRRARAGHVDTWSHARCVGSTDLPGVLGVLVAALIMSVLPTGNAAPVTPCGAALAAPGATAILRARSDVPMCLVDTSLLNTSAVFAVEQASTQVDAVVDRFDAVVGRFGSELDVVLNTSAVQEQASTAGRCGSQYVRSFSELDTVLETVLAQQTKLDAQAAVVACLTGCIATGSCT